MQPHTPPGDVENNGVSDEAPLPPVGEEGEESLSEIPMERGETGASLPAVEEVRMDANSGGGRPQSYWTSLRCYVLFFVLLLVCFIGLGIGLSTRSNDGGSGGSSGSQSRKFSVEALAEYLEQSGVTSTDDIFDIGSPQSQAAAWLANEDGRNLPLPRTVVGQPEDPQFLQRYVLATLYYATDGESWLLDSNFLSSDDVCAWRTTRLNRQSEIVDFGVLCDASSNTNVLALYLDDNRLKGTIPSEITQLTTLLALDFDFDDVSGQLPSDINKLSNLQVLAMASNDVSGPIPESICDILPLRAVLLHYNSLTGNLPTCLGRLRNLEILYLSNNMLSGVIPSDVSDIMELRVITLDDNMLSGDISTTFNGMAFLQFLHLEDNSFEGRVDDNFLADNQLLLHVDMSDNDLTGFIPSHFFDPGEHPLLELLDFHGNRISGELPLVIPDNVMMKFLSLHENSIGGPVPESLDSLKALFHLDLSSNSFTGPMPAFVGNLTRLNYLFLANNTFDVGPVPDSYADLIRLEEFSVKRTLREGPLPDWLGNLSSLILLDLDQNNFQGAIPNSLGLLTNMQFLLLNRNDLSGDLPSSFSNMTSLRTILLEGNTMEGNIDILCDLPNFQDPEASAQGTEVMAADCLDGSGLICTCCTNCCPHNLDFPEGTEGLEDENTCHDLTSIVHLDPIWEFGYERVIYDFKNDTRLVDPDFLT